MAKRNITLSLPEETLRSVKVLAAKRETSVSAMLSETLEALAREESGYEQARREFMSVAERGFDLGTNGRANWSRVPFGSSERSFLLLVSGAVVQPAAVSVSGSGAGRATAPPAWSEASSPRSDRSTARAIRPRTG
jgi:hypothetical protein